MKPSAARPSILEISPLIAALCILAVLLVILRVVQVVPELGAGGVVVDFDAFYIAGQMVWEGSIASAYDPAVTMARQSELIGQPIFMPWSYPPQFDLLVALLPLGSRGVSYALFTLLSFALFLWPLWRLSGRYLPAVLFASVPTICFNAYIGQNGFVTGALMGWMALAWLQGSARGAGIPLGLMVIKPHLALGIGLLALVTRRFGVIGWALLMVLGTSALATLVLGPEIWTAFFKGTAAAKRNMDAGFYPLFRMNSVYATAHSLRLGSGAALALHGAVALGALAATVWAALFSGWTPRRVLGFALLLTLTISPYSYDYDTPIMTMGLALLAADLVERGRIWERFLIMALAWGAGGAGLTLSMVRVVPEETIYLTNWFPVALGAFCYLPLIALVWLILRRIHAEDGVAAQDRIYSSPSFAAR